MIDGIKLVRVDFRLIHGQVITKWSNTISAKEIIVVNDQLSKDEYMAEIYIMAAPPGMKVNVLSINDFVTQAKNNAYASGNVLVLFKNIKDARDTVDLGIPFKQVQVGGLGSGNGRTSVVKGISIDAADVDFHFCWHSQDTGQDSALIVANDFQFHHILLIQSDIPANLDHPGKVRIVEDI